MSFTKEKDAMPVVHNTSDDISAASLQMQHEGEGPIEFDAEEEKILLRKIDMRLIPSVWIMYLLSYLDRGNIGNAYTVS
jgi:hypothetical protein